MSSPLRKVLTARLPWGLTRGSLPFLSLLLFCCFACSDRPGKSDGKHGNQSRQAVTLQEVGCFEIEATALESAEQVLD